MPIQSFDITVIGGGPAGVAAASAAASLGRFVALIERSNRLGGSVVAAMHRSLCGLYSQPPKSPLETLNPGTQRQVVGELLRLAPDGVVAKSFGKTVVLEFPAAAYEAALSSLCDSPNIVRLMNTSLTGVQCDGGRITAVDICSRDACVALGDQPGHEATQASQLQSGSFIDCTGAGALLQLLGERVMHPSDTQRMLGGYSLRLTGLTGDAETLRLQIPYALTKAVNFGLLPPEARFVMFHPGPGAGEGICKLAIRPDQFADADIHSLAEKVIEHLRRSIPAFADVNITAASPHVLPRDGRRLLGKATMTENDVLTGRQIGTEAIHAWWPIEQWDLATGPSYAYPPIGMHYDIPIEALHSTVIPNLFAAGTCVSATASAAASLRASGICLATGHAAGIAAAQNL